MFKGAKGAKSSTEKVEKGREVIIESRNEVGMAGKDVEEQGCDRGYPSVAQATICFEL